MPNISAVAGEPLYVACPVAGYPIDSIVWQKGKLTEIIKFSKLRLFSFVVCCVNSLLHCLVLLAKALSHFVSLSVLKIFFVTCNL
jgi:hypothetical protein